ncbi:hypothetical protein G9A89_014108 [Geosiphon pyriformis]|nr:hypothetical protein G9A89_014108 [Geosiphon pyriformis]
MEAWTGEKRASKSLKKLDRPSKLPSKEVKKAAQIEAALRKCNPEILDKINKRKSVEKFDEQMDNLFETNKDIVNLEETAKNMEDSKSSLSSRMPSPSLGQKKTCSVHADIGHIGKKHGNEGGVDLQPVGRYFSQIARRDQARKIQADVEIDGIANQMAGQRKVLVRDIPLSISDREIKVAGKWQSAVVEFNNQEEATRAVDQWSTLIRKNAVRIYPMIGTQKIIEQRKTWEAKLVGLLQNCTAHYLSTTLDQIKA